MPNVPAVEGGETPFRVEPRRARVDIHITGRHLQTDPIHFGSDGTPDPYNDLLQVVVHKDLADTTGAFTLTLTARRDPDGRTWAHKISPMDYVEIRFAEDAQSEMTIVMRGFVTSARESFTFTNNQPQAAVLVQGHDYGKLLVRCGLFIVLSESPEEISFGGDVPVQKFFQERWGITAQDGDSIAYAVKPSHWVSAIVDTAHGILESYISLKDAPDLHYLVDDGEFESDFMVPFGSVTAILGSLQNLIDAWKADPWYEWYIDENPKHSTGPAIVWRLAPFFKADGALIKLGDITPKGDTTPILFYLKELVDLDIGREDTNQYSYFMTLPEMLADADYGTRNILGIPEPDGAAVWRHDLNLQFGFRPLQRNFPLLWFDNFRDKSAQDAAAQGFMETTRRLNHWLDDAFGSVYLQENGTVTLRGSPRFLFAHYARLSETGQTWYIEGVDHTYSIDPPSYTTKLTLTRGFWPQGFSPYAAMTPDYTTHIGMLSAVSNYSPPTLPRGYYPGAVGQPGSPTTLPGFPTQPSDQPPAAGESCQEQALQQAYTQNGKPYLWAGQDPNGFDCSGLVYWAYGQIGQRVPRTAQTQYDASTHLTQSQLQVGDLVFFQGTYDSFPDIVSHVGFYVGNNQALMATAAGGTVLVADLSDPHWQQHFYGYGRLPCAPSTPAPGGPGSGGSGPPPVTPGSQTPPRTSGGCYYPSMSTQVTQPFGSTGEVTGEPFHSGADLANGFGGAVFAPQGGHVIGVRTCPDNPTSTSNDNPHSGGPLSACTTTGQSLQETTGYGSYIWIQNDDGSQTILGHTSPDGLTPGQRVEAGARIGHSNGSGFATGPHTHWEVRVGGQAVDPFSRCGR